MLGASSAMCRGIPLATLGLSGIRHEAHFLLQMLGYCKEFEVRGISVPSNCFQLEA